MKNSPTRSGFTTVEIVIVLLVLVLLASMAVPHLNGRIAVGRDTQRLEDMRTIQDAIERYHRDRGAYPPPSGDKDFGGWDASCEDDFIPDLVRKGYLHAVPRDPLDDERYHYRYFVYEEGEYGCRGLGPFYVLALTRFENDEVAAHNPGCFRCSGRDWTREFAFVTGAESTEAASGMDAAPEVEASTEPHALR